jgi:hypothetical protein
VVSRYACGAGIFSYLPNPRIWKAPITARLCGVEVEVRGKRLSKPPDFRFYSTINFQTLTPAPLRTSRDCSIVQLSSRMSRVISRESPRRLKVGGAGEAPCRS